MAAELHDMVQDDLRKIYGDFVKEVRIRVSCAAGPSVPSCRPRLLLPCSALPAWPVARGHVTALHVSPASLLLQPSFCRGSGAAACGTGVSAFSTIEHALVYPCVQVIELQDHVLSTYDRAISTYTANVFKR